MSIKLSILFYSLILLFLHFTVQVTLDKITSDVTDILYKLTEEVKKSYFNRCSECKNCSKPTCSFINNYLKCLDKVKILSCTECSGSLTDTEHSVFQMSNFYSTNQENKYKILNVTIIQNTICYTALLDDFFVQYKNYDDYLQLLYFSTGNGIHRTYPGKINCRIYDHKLRPWWNGAVTGSKNIIFLLEVSKLYSSNAEFEIAKSIAKVINDGASYSDYICFVIYSTEIDGFKVIQECSDAISDLKTKVKAYIDSLNYNNIKSTKKSIDYFTMLDSLFKFIRMSEYTGNTIGSDIFLIHITSGFHPIESQNSDNIFNYYLKLKENLILKYKKLDIYNYLINSNIDIKIFNKIACDTNGSTEIVKSSNDIESKVNIFYFSLMISNRHSYVNWAAPYDDANGIGKVTTGSIPIFVLDYGGLTFLGTASADILISSVEKSYDNNMSFIERILKSKSRLNASKLTTNTCDLDKIRSLQCTPEEERAHCDSSKVYLNTYPDCIEKTSNKVLCNLQNDDGNIILSTESTFSLIDLVNKSPCCINCMYSKIKIIIIIVMTISSLMVIFGLCLHKKLTSHKKRINIEDFHNNIKDYVLLKIFKEKDH